MGWSCGHGLELLSNKNTVLRYTFFWKVTQPWPSFSNLDRIEEKNNKSLRFHLQFKLFIIFHFGSGKHFIYGAIKWPSAPLVLAGSPNHQWSSLTFGNFRSINLFHDLLFSLSGTAILFLIQDPSMCLLCCFDICFLHFDPVSFKHIWISMISVFVPFFPHLQMQCYCTPGQYPLSGQQYRPVGTVQYNSPQSQPMPPPPPAPTQQPGNPPPWPVGQTATCQPKRASSYPLPSITLMSLAWSLYTIIKCVSP